MAHPEQPIPEALPQTVHDVEVAQPAAAPLALVAPRQAILAARWSF